MISKLSQVGTKMLKSNRFFYPIKTFKIQKMAESVESVQIKQFLKQPGEFVNEDDEILEYDSDKGSTIQRIPEGGKVIKYLVKVDEEYPVLTDYVEIDTDAKPDATKQASEPKAESTPPKETA